MQRDVNWVDDRGWVGRGGREGGREEEDFKLNKAMIYLIAAS